MVTKKKKTRKNKHIYLKECDRCQKCFHSIKDHDNSTWACTKCNCGIYSFPISHFN